MPATEEAVATAVAAAVAADERSARDIVLLEVADVLILADVFVVASATNERQVAAIASAIEERLHTEGRKALRREGTPASGWMLLDYGDVICHVMHEEQRGHYALERLWSDVPKRDAATGAVIAA